MMLSTLPGVVEAHLPQCYVPGIVDNPAQVLFVVISDVARSVAASEIEHGLGRILPREAPLDFMLLDELSPELGAIRRANCRIA
jgi:hypothetical protein